ncbi:hypothetical protein N7493_005193 [Penicillium malachiteum]|uniref:Uncharacterized protein n=1 Tax=Penicillium malachiteum TaxID=1324776 RepID=A0AAD6HMG3_9EURO|nr:hypothetical protein N7493_005193 [Penicillium malachiteum]
MAIRPERISRYKRETDVWVTGEFGYFDPDYCATAKHVETKYEPRLGMHVNIFHNLEAFLDQIRGFHQFKPELLIRDNLHLTLRGEALGWYNTELDRNERAYLRYIDINTARGWCGRLYSRFTLSLTRTRLYLVYGLSGDTICETARNIVHYARGASVHDPYIHMQQIWRYLMRVRPAHANCIETPTQDTMFSDFMRQLWLAEQNVFSDNETNESDAETDDSMAMETWVGLNGDLRECKAFKEGV